MSGLLPEGIRELIPETILDAVVPLAVLPQTGDVAHPGLWLLQMILSACGLIGLAALRKYRI